MCPFLIEVVFELLEKIAEFMKTRNGFGRESLVVDNIMLEAEFDEDTVAF